MQHQSIPGRQTVAEPGQLLDLGIQGVGGAEHIAAGSFADVYKAPHESLGLMVAVKVLRAVVPEAAARLAFERDCQAMAELSQHPNLVNLYAGGLTADGLPYLVSDWFAGGSLAARLKRQGPFRPGRAIDLIAKVTEALEVAHSAGVVHRDIKPSNILLTKDGEPALGDVGIARLEGRHQVASMRVPAGFLHTAPEVLEGHSPTEASDIYSLGSTIFEILIGRAAYFSADDDSVWPLMKRTLSQPFPDASKFGAYEPFADLIHRATARNPADRYGSAGELLAALRSMPPPTASSDPSPGSQFERVASGIDPQGELVSEEPIGDLIGARVQEPSDEPPQYDAGGQQRFSADLDNDLDLLPALGPPEPNLEDQGPLAVEQLVDPANANGRGESLHAALLRGTQPDSQPESPKLGFEERLRAIRNPAPRPAEKLPSPEISTVSKAPVGLASVVPSLPPDEASIELGPAVGGPQFEHSNAEQELHDLLSEDPPKSRRASTAGSSDGSALRGILIGLLAAAMLAVASWQFVLSNRSSTADEDFSGPAISLVEAGNGPLEAGEPYAVTIADSVGAEATYRFVVDGSPVGEPAASPPSHIALAGRRELQLEVTSGATTSLSPPVSYYGVAPIEPGYRANLAVVEANAASWPQALDVYDALVSDGHELELIVSDRVAGVSPGRWLIAVGGFGSNSVDAEAYCAESSLTLPQECWAGFFETNSVG